MAELDDLLAQVAQLQSALGASERARRALEVEVVRLREIAIESLRRARIATDASRARDGSVGST